MNLVFQAVISTIARIKWELKAILVRMDECDESFNLVVNAVADVLHALYNEVHQEQRGYQRDG